MHRGCGYGLGVGLRLRNHPLYFTCYRNLRSKLEEAREGRIGTSSVCEDVKLGFSSGFGFGLVVRVRLRNPPLYFTYNA